MEKEWFKDQPFNSFWEKGYNDMKVSTMGGPNHDIVELAEGLPKNAKVLDLGCGEGRNSFYLAGKDCEVTAVDRSASGIKKLAHLAKKENYNIKTYVDDIRDFPIDEEYDLIMSHGVIDYLENNEWRKLLTQIKKMTKPGGYNAYTCMIFNDKYPAPPEFCAAEFKHCLKRHELGEFYSDWNIIRYDYYVKWDQHPGIPLHAHPPEKLIVQKPGGNNLKAIISEVPIGDTIISDTLFEKIYMGMPKTELLTLCGKPDVIDTFSMRGIQLGVSSDMTYDGYNLALWYYGNLWIYVINDVVWGKSKSLIDTPPIRIGFKEN